MKDTEHLGKLRAIEEHELEIMLEWRNASAVRNSMFNTDIISLKNHLEWWEKIKPDDSLQYYFYEYEGAPYGVVCFKDIDKLKCQATWGFYTSPNAKQGMGTKMLLLALDLAFDDMNIHSVYGEVIEYNLSSIKIHEKLGFERQAKVKHDGSISKEYDIYQYNIDEKSWFKSRSRVLAVIKNNY